ncbi:MAG: FAD-binding oxidoreductase [Actinomycetota bacterium]|nr:FAD-binding oxidoreductase [Actinomycetota bacterium]
MTLAALDVASSTPLWLDSPHRPEPRVGLAGDVRCDLAVVGGGFTGLWAALLALEESPGREVVVIEGARLGWAASGRNGGFCAASLTHGLGNGVARWPDEMPQLLRLGHENLDAIGETVAALSIDCCFERAGGLDVAVAPWQLEGLREVHEQAGALGEPSVLLDADDTRALVDSPTYVGGLLDERGIAMVDPARLVWGLAAAVERMGGRIVEETPVTGWRDHGDTVELQTSGGQIHAGQVVLATNVFPSLVKRSRPLVVPVWDHVIATEPLTADQLGAIGWSGRQGVGDAGNQFHYYRLSQDNRLVWGGYDALYYFGSDLSAARARSAHTESVLAEHLLATFPQLDGVRFSHTWGGAIDTCTRFSPFWGRAMSGRVAYVAGYTGLGVGSSRFGAQVCLDLLAGRDNERTRLSMVRRKPLPFPPEPLRWAAIQLTRRSIARADASEGRRDIWLRTLDRLGLGFDS